MGKDYIGIFQNDFDRNKNNLRSQLHIVKLHYFV